VWIEVLYSSNPHKTSRSPNSTQNDEEPDLLATEG